MTNVAERYLLLGLRLDRHVDGAVDAYFGPPELRKALEAEPPVEPGELAAEADALVDALDDGWLRDQAAALRTYAAALAGEPLSYADEVEGCYGVRPAWTDEAVFTEAHERLEELLPGNGALAERREAWRNAMRVPPQAAAGAVEAVVRQARVLVRDLLDLPAGEEVSVEGVRDEPWLAYNHYLGGLRSRISVNVDLPISAAELLHLALHETYPGHHAERAVKEQVLVRERGLLEETIVLVPTPQSLVSEGIAELGPSLLLEGDGGPRLTAALGGAGAGLDLEQALAVDRAHEPCRWAEVNAALLLHDDGAGAAEVQAYLERWGLLPPELSAHVVRFLEEPTSRTYILTYAAGRELCREYVAGDPERFRRLLTEQVRVGELVAASGGRAQR